MPRTRARLLLDTRPLTEFLLDCIGAGEEPVAEAVASLGLQLASVWPVFTEALYFTRRQLGKCRDLAVLVDRLRGCLGRVGEERVEFHEAVRGLGEDLAIADAALLEALASNPLLVLVSADAKLVGKARKKGLQAVTIYELYQLSPSSGRDSAKTRG